MCEMILHCLMLILHHCRYTAQGLDDYCHEDCKTNSLDAQAKMFFPGSLEPCVAIPISGAAEHQL